MPFIRIYLNDVLTDQVELNDEPFFIGRDSNNSIVIDNAGVSSYHAVIEKEDGSYYISDNNSTNGIFVNGKKTTRQALEYWDEIQIYNYILKFMATSSLEKSEDPDIAQDGKPGQAGTMEVDMSDVQDLLKLRDQKKVPYLQILNAKGTHTKISIQEDNFTIGRAKESDLRTSGWFSPAVVAEIKRQSDGYYLVTHNNKNVLVNGKQPETSTKLSDGDKLRVRNRFMTFHHRLLKSKK